MIDYALTTKTRIKSRLQINTTSFDDVIETMIAATTAKIEQMAGRRFKDTTYTQELYDGVDAYGDRMSYIVLKNSPIISFTSLEYKSGNNEDPTWFEYTSNDYDLNETSGVIYFNSDMPRGRQNVRATYRAGYLIDFDTSDVYSTAHTLPFDISEVCEEVVVRLFKKRDSEGRSQESFQESSVTWNENVFTPENVTTINNYRRVVL